MGLNKTILKYLKPINRLEKVSTTMFVAQENT